ncbi:MAG: hypothetical protein HZB56_03945 [Deltaproteobacteria bacterium]|nr:hypothetical protein [Deltaproteobacteria bacterium]
MRAALVTAAAALLLVLVPGRASGGAVATPVGPTAIPRDYCGSDPAPAGWRFSAGYGLLQSTIRFTGVSADFTHHSVLAGVSRRLRHDLTVQLSAGALLSGTWNLPGAPGTLNAGPMAQLSATWMALEGGSGWPFVALGAGLSAFTAGVSGAGNVGIESVTAGDLSLSATVGRSLWGTVAPYVGARVFGGPVHWTLGGQKRSGDDTHHFQVALGLAAALPAGFDLLVEGSPLGQRSISASAGWSF